MDWSVQEDPLQLSQHEPAERGAEAETTPWMKLIAFDYVSDDGRVATVELKGRTARRHACPLAPLCRCAVAAEVHAHRATRTQGVPTVLRPPPLRTAPGRDLDRLVQGADVGDRLPGGSVRCGRAGPPGPAARRTCGAPAPAPTSGRGRPRSGPLLGRHAAEPSPGDRVRLGRSRWRQPLVGRDRRRWRLGALSVRGDADALWPDRREDRDGYRHHTDTHDDDADHDHADEYHLDHANDDLDDADDDIDDSGDHHADDIHDSDDHIDDSGDHHADDIDDSGDHHADRLDHDDLGDHHADHHERDAEGPTREHREPPYDAHFALGAVLRSATSTAPGAVAGKVSQTKNLKCVRADHRRGRHVSHRLHAGANATKAERSRKAGSAKVKGAARKQNSCTPAHRTKQHHTSTLTFQIVSVSSNNDGAAGSEGAQAQAAAEAEPRNRCLGRAAVHQPVQPSRAPVLRLAGQEHQPASTLSGPDLQGGGTPVPPPWQLLAAINREETDYGKDLNVSSAGAASWMQFCGTWETYGLALNRHNKVLRNVLPNPYNPRDAIFSAARYLRAAAAWRSVPRAVFAYNHADWYVVGISIAEQISNT